MIPREIVDEILARTPLADLIGRHVELRKRGREHVGLCPFHSEKTPSFTINEAKGFFHCFGCLAHGDAIDWVMRADGLDFVTAIERLREGAGITGTQLSAAETEELRREREHKRAAQEAEEREKQERALEIWREAEPSIAGTPAEVYLRGRGLDPARLMTDPPGWPETLRWSVDASTEPDGRDRPAMVVAVNDARTGLVRGLQRIRLHRDGRPVIGKEGKKVKLSLGTIEANAARFSSWPDPEGRWGIAEGSETALAATQLFQIPVWSAISSGNMPNVQPPYWARHATVFADHDDGGVIAAAETRALYLETPGIESVRIIAAERMKADVADLVTGAA